MQEYRNKPTGLLIGGLVLNILATIAYFIVIVISFVVYGVALAVGTTAGAVVGGEAGAQQAADNIQIPGWLTVVVTLCVIMVIYAVIAFPFTIAALVINNKAQGRKMCMLAGIFAIIASVPTFFIPLELIAGIKLLRIRNTDFEEDPVYWKD